MILTADVFLTRFVKEWVYHGVLNDTYGEFMITVNDDYLRFRGMWTISHARNGYHSCSSIVMKVK